MKQQLARVGSNPDSGIAHFAAHRRGGRGLGLLDQAQHYLAALGELDRIADQVDQHLLQPGGVATQQVRHVIVRHPGSDRRRFSAHARQTSPPRSRPPARGRSRSCCSTTLPAASLEKSSRSLTMPKSRSVLSCTVSAYSRCSGLSSVPSSSWVMPIMPLSGVRISWLMLLRNSDTNAFRLQGDVARCFIWSSADLRALMSRRTTIPPRMVPSSVLTGRAEISTQRSFATVGPYNMNWALLTGSPVMARDERPVLHRDWRRSVSWKQLIFVCHAPEVAPLKVCAKHLACAAVELDQARNRGRKRSRPRPCCRAQIARGRAGDVGPTARRRNRRLLTRRARHRVGIATSGTPTCSLQSRTNLPSIHL